MNDYVKLVFKTMLKTRGWWLNLFAIVFAILDAAIVILNGYASIVTASFGWLCVAMWAFSSWILEARLKIKDDDIDN